MTAYSALFSRVPPERLPPSVYRPKLGYRILPTEIYRRTDFQVYCSAVDYRRHPR